MEIFKTGEYVYTKNDFIHGKIVEINENEKIAYVEFRTDGGGGCLPFEFSELMHEIWCITTKDFSGDEMYLAWQNPGWNEDGYFWTFKDVFQKMISRSTTEYPFVFYSRKSAIQELKNLDIPQKCRIVKLVD